MGKMEKAAADVSTPEQQAGTESHYHSKKDRIFVRAIAGKYSLTDELAKLRAMPRVRRAADLKFRDGPQTYSRHYVEPKDGITQTFHLHLEEYGPGGRSQKHGHVNEAAFYILDGEGYEIHDGIRYDWKAGDVAIVHNNCVHQHFNASTTRPARALVIKTKPMYMFMNMLFQKQVEPRPTEPAAGPAAAAFSAREQEQDFNH
jgi:mannose-6-phosphate isomerase-like protein (cupin superfamily)